MSKEVSNSTILTCPNCSSRSEVTMPLNACVVLWVCPQCAVELRPKVGDCCVFCSYSTTPCPPVQAMQGEHSP